MIQVQIKGLKEVEKMMAELPNNLNKEILNKSEEFMRFVQKSAKLRAPKYTGFLADQIKITKKGNSIILDTGEAYYAYYQEFGFASHIIPFAYFKQHITAPAIPGQPVSARSFITVSKHTPFLFPALELGISNLPNMLHIGANNAIKKSRR